jgi:hypothetical protein
LSIARDGSVTVTAPFSVMPQAEHRRIPRMLAARSMRTGGIGAPAQLNLLKPGVVGSPASTALHRSATKGVEAMLKVTPSAQAIWSARRASQISCNTVVALRISGSMARYA